MRIISFAPYTNQIFQVLDLTLLGVLKFIMKLYHEFQQTMLPRKIWGTFHALGLDFDMRREPYRLLFDGQS
jgi:hypothetical protein